MVQTPCDLHLKLIKWRDAVYSHDTVPKVYLPDCLSLPWDLIDSLYLLAVLLPSSAVGRWGVLKKNGAHDRPYELGEGWIFVI